MNGTLQAVSMFSIRISADLESLVCILLDILKHFCCSLAKEKLVFLSLETNPVGPDGYYLIASDMKAKSQIWITSVILPDKWVVKPLFHLSTVSSHALAKRAPTEPL